MAVKYFPNSVRFTACCRKENAALCWNNMKESGAIRKTPRTPSVLPLASGFMGFWRERRRGRWPHAAVAGWTAAGEGSALRSRVRAANLWPHGAAPSPALPGRDRPGLFFSCRSQKSVPFQTEARVDCQGAGDLERIEAVRQNRRLSICCHRHSTQ